MGPRGYEDFVDKIVKLTSKNAFFNYYFKMSESSSAKRRIVEVFKVVK